MCFIMSIKERNTIINAININKPQIKKWKKEMSNNLIKSEKLRKENHEPT